MIPVRVEEAVSDQEGKIYFDDFWDWHLFENRYPTLTIYKPKYVCWDQKYIFPFRKKRTDFNKDNRVVKMEKWKEGSSYGDHWMFSDSVTQGDTSMAEERLFEKAFNYEQPFRLRERNEKNKRLREKRKRRNK